MPATTGCLFRIQQQNGRRRGAPGARPRAGGGGVRELRVVRGAPRVRPAPAALGEGAVRPGGGDDVGRPEAGNHRGLYEKAGNPGFEKKYKKCWFFELFCRFFYVEKVKISKKCTLNMLKGEGEKTFFFATHAGKKFHQMV